MAYSNRLRYCVSDKLYGSDSQYGTSIVVTRYWASLVMTLHVVAQQLVVDRLELSMRYEEGNYEALGITKYLLKHLFIDEGLAIQIHRRPYSNNRFPPYAVHIPLSGRHGEYLFVECGYARNWHQTITSYVKFTFNPSRLLANETARGEFKDALLAIIPSGGLQVLLEESYVLYAEFSADFRGVKSESIDAYSPNLEHSRYFSQGGAPKSIVLHDDKPGRQSEISIYDKKQADWVKYLHLRRGPLVRIESKRRFNRTPSTRRLRLHDVHRIDNPFASVQIYDREIIANTFKAKRHTRFLAQAQSLGVHAALSGTRGADRERRERMLEDCVAEWWDPQLAWSGVSNAVSGVLSL